MGTYVIAEIGQNHNGDLRLAKKLVDVAAMPIMDHAYGRELPGVDAIKLQMRDMEWELSAEAYNEPYDSPHAFGRTYGEHREALELSVDEHEEVYHYATERGLGVVETLCAPSCLKILDRFTPARLKVASRDLTNHPLLGALAATRLPLILSTGMSDEHELDRALDVVTKHHENVAILHCVSVYPADYPLLNLLAIEWLRARYPFYDIGFSDHSRGIVAAPVAVTLGATIIEKHVTLSHHMKGSDHAASLEPVGLWRMTRDIRNMEAALGRRTMAKPPEVESARLKLERSVGTKRPLPAGTQIAEDDLVPISPGTGARWTERERFVGGWTVNALDARTILTATMLLRAEGQGITIGAVRPRGRIS